jgi:quercetin dioxygenase-like cupin family protein
VEREKVKDLDPLQNTTYEKVIGYYKGWAEREKNGQLLVKGDELEFQQSRQGFIKYYLLPLFDHTAVSSWAVFEHLIKSQSGRHRHQGGIIIYVVEGEGRTETDDTILEWKAGDLLLLPIKPNGSSHQHWNKDASKGCRWIAFRDMLLARYIANAIDQVAVMPELKGAPQRGPTGTVRKEWKATVSGEQPPLVTSPDELSKTNLFDRLVELRDVQRKRLAQTTFLIRGDELPWELNAHGKMQWYLHPLIAYSAVQTHIFYRQEIAPGSRSGTQQHGGDVVFYILSGEGCTEVNGVKHNWKAGDVMTLPTFGEGVVYRHLNTGSAPVQLVCMERNLVHTTGVDRQSGFEQLQPCPEYRAMK